MVSLSRVTVNLATRTEHHNYNTRAGKNITGKHIIFQAPSFLAKLLFILLDSTAHSCLYLFLSSGVCVAFLFYL